MKMYNLSFPNVDRDLRMDPQIWYLVNSSLLKVEAASGFVVQQFWPGDQIWNNKSCNGTVEDIKHRIHQANLSAYAI